MRLLTNHRNKRHWLLKKRERKIIELKSCFVNMFAQQQKFFEVNLIFVRLQFAKSASSVYQSICIYLCASLSR